MSSILKVDTIQDQSGNNIINENADTITIGASGDTISIPSGATFDASNATVTIPAVNLTTGVTGTLPVANGGTNLTSGFANGITEADMFRLTADTNSGTSGDVTTNWERVDDASFSKIGTGLTESSGIFSFPSTGIYLISFNANLAVNVSEAFTNVRANVTQNNSTYDPVAVLSGSCDGNRDFIGSLSIEFIVDVTDISNVKFKFTTAFTTVGTRLRGDSTESETAFTCIRLGDT